MEVRKINNGEVELRCQLSDVRIEQRDGESAGRTVTGYAAKFDKWSEPIYGWFVELIRGGAFDECDTTDAIMCFNHNVDDILARTASKTLTLSVDEVGLRFSFDAPNTTTGNNMVELLWRRDISQCSFRFIVGKDEWLYADEKNGLKYDQRTILSVSKLYDVALVVYPAYKDTEASVRHLEERKAEYFRSLQPEGEAEPDSNVPPANDASEETGDPPAADQQEEQPDKDVATAQSLSRDRLVAVMEIAKR